MTTFHSGVNFRYHTETIFLRTINIYGLRIAGNCCFIDYYANCAGIAQEQDFFNNFKTNSHRHIYVRSIPTFSCSKIRIGYK